MRAARMATADKEREREKKVYALIKKITHLKNIKPKKGFYDNGISMELNAKHTNEVARHF